MNDSPRQEADLPPAAPDAPATPAPSADPTESSDQTAPTPAEAEPEDEADYEEEIEDDGPTAQDLRDDIAASAAETRRSTRRTMEVLKEFGSAISSMSVMLKDVHTSARATVASSQAASDELSKDWALALVDLHDRISRQAAAFQKSPGPTSAWWPGSKAALTPWAEAWSTQQAAVSILQGHLENLLARAQLQRIPTAGLRFDPATMSAVEARPDPSVPDHSVLGELLPGWRNQATNQILRPAQVCVARNHS